MMLKNAVLNALGLGFPLLVGLFVFPLLMQEMGGERFGLLTLIWTMVGYFNLFDFGVSRALTRLMSIEMARGPKKNLAIAGSGLIFLVFVGVLSGVFVLISGEYFLSLLYPKESIYFQEASGAINWVAISLPFVLLSSGCVGIVESLGKFFVLNLIRIFFGASIFIAPLISFVMNGSLVDVTFCLFALRLVYCFVVLYFALSPIWKYSIINFSISHIKSLFAFGAWITLSNVVGPIMLYGDRFIVASLSGVAISGYYGITNEILTKILILPSAIMGAAFPLLSKFVIDKAASVQAYRRALKITMVTVCLALIFVGLLGKTLASYWMGNEFGDVFKSVLPFFLAGILFNSIGLVAQGFVQAANRPDLTAKLHVLELFIYILYAYHLIREYSVIGAAVAWAMRTLLSMLALCFLSSKIIKEVD